QNHELLNAATSFVSGSMSDYRHFSVRRRQAFREAAQTAMQLPEPEWPVLRRRSGTRPGRDTVRRAEELRCRRDRAAKELDLEPSFIAPRSTIETIAANETHAATLLVPWQKELLGIKARPRGLPAVFLLKIAQRLNAAVLLRNNQGLADGECFRIVNALL